MKVFKLKEKAEIPSYATEGSACFDLRACFDLDDRIRTYNPLNRELFTPIKLINGRIGVQVPPSFRMLLPTGLIFNIPKQNVMNIFIRSSLALKEGIALANGVAVIDSDYVDETFILIYNISDNVVSIFDGDRIAQAMLRPVSTLVLEESKTKPAKKTNREGGMGSTGI